MTQNVRVLILNKLNEQFERKKNILFSPQDEQVQSSEVNFGALLFSPLTQDRTIPSNTLYIIVPSLYRFQLREVEIHRVEDEQNVQL